MADLVEALQMLARQRGRDDSPLVAVRVVPGRPGLRISHLPISQPLAHAWVTLTGEPFHQHQSLALASLRRGEPLALVGGRPARQTLHLLAIELLRAEAPATILVLAPDEPAAAAQRDGLAQITAALNEPLRVAMASGSETRAALSAHIVVTTPTTLHERLLRYHERAWAAFWSRLRLIVIAEAHTYGGLAAAHLSALLLRAQRLTPVTRPPQLAATIASVTGANAALALITGSAWRIIAADDVPTSAAALALWAATGERTREAAALALGLAHAGAARVHLTCAPFEVPLLKTLVGATSTTISVGPSPLPAQAQIFLGVAGAGAHVQQALDSAALTVLLLGDDPAERTVARLAASDPVQLPFIDGQPPTWVLAPGNAYVAAQHLVCAANELPFCAAEVEAWQAATIIPRLETSGRLIRLPGTEPAWQPLAGGNDPYRGFTLRSAGDAAATIRNDQGTVLGSLDGAAFDRWGFTGAALPSLRGGFRVTARDEEALTLVVHAAPEPRRTIPLRHCVVRVRDRREQRVLRGRELAWGRVVVEEEIYGYREVTSGSDPVEQSLKPPITTSWSAPALWIDLPAAINVDGQLSGWSLAAALPLRALATISDLVPAYDAEAQRIYFIDAQPGGSGLAIWLFTCLEELLPLAYAVALDCRSDPLLEPLARADIDWLRVLLGVEREPKSREPSGGAGRRAASAPVSQPVEAPVRPSSKAASREHTAQVEQERLATEAQERTMRQQQKDEQRHLREAREQAEREQAERVAQAQAEREQAERTVRERAERERAERDLAERDLAERTARERAERTARDLAERDLAERTARDLAERELAERTARDLAERELAERTARELAERTARELAERELAERTAREQAERTARELAERTARDLAERELAERTARELAERTARDLAERELAERELAERTARELAERELAERTAAWEQTTRQQAARVAHERASESVRAAQARAERDLQDRAERAIREHAAREPKERAATAERERVVREREIQEALERAERAGPERQTRERKGQQATREREQAARGREQAARERAARPAKTSARTPAPEAPPPAPRTTARGRVRQPAPSEPPVNQVAEPSASVRPDAPRSPASPAPRPESPEPAPTVVPPPVRQKAPRPAPEPLPDAAAMVSRLRHMREQRERLEVRQPASGEAPPPQRTIDAAAPAAPRFSPGDQIICTPYGRGEVIERLVENDRELLDVHFPAHGRLTIDVSVSAARLVAATTPVADDDPPL